MCDRTASGRRDSEYERRPSLRKAGQKGRRSLESVTAREQPCPLVQEHRTANSVVHRHCDQAAVFADLALDRVGYSLNASLDQDDVIWSIGLPTGCGLAADRYDVTDGTRRENRTRRLGTFVIGQKRDDLAGKLGNQRCGIAGLADYQNIVARLELRELNQLGEHPGRQNLSAWPDLQALIAIGQARKPSRKKFLARNGRHGRGDAPVRHVARTDLAFDHILALQSGVRHGSSPHPRFLTRHTLYARRDRGATGTPSHVIGLPVAACKERADYVRRPLRSAGVSRPLKMRYPKLSDSVTSAVADRRPKRTQARPRGGVVT